MLSERSSVIDSAGSDHDDCAVPRAAIRAG